MFFDPEKRRIKKHELGLSRRLARRSLGKGGRPCEGGQGLPE